MNLLGVREGTGPSMDLPAPQFQSKIALDLNWSVNLLGSFLKLGKPGEGQFLSEIGMDLTRFLGAP